jgi:sugar-specific transcriptional regulator TrmB
VRWPDLAVLEEAGFTQYEARALVALAVHGVADAATLCREGRIPTSKIYLAMEKLEGLGMAEIQRSRPRLYSALPAELVASRLTELARARAEDFARRAQELRATLAALPGRLRGGRTLVDLALGVESHVKRHLARVAAARRRVLSYLEAGDLDAIDRAAGAGFDVLRRIARNAAARKLEHRVIFGFAARGAPRLLDFLRAHASSLGHLSGLRYSGELGHPFHVVDEETVILCLDHPFVPEGRFASLLVHDRALAECLATGFEGLWRRTLSDLGEMRFDPRAGR